MVPLEEAPANSVPAAAVIQRVQALFGITGRKEFVGGLDSTGLKNRAQPWECFVNVKSRVSERIAEFLV